MDARKTLVVTTVLSDPFVMEKGDGSYEGFIIDVLDRIAEKLGFVYKLQPARDGQYGHKDPNTGLWTGMIGELIRKEADLAAADLTITEERERVVDFTKPFLSQTVKILAKRPTPVQQMFGNLLEPFTAELWVYILAALVIVSILFMLIGRFSPYEWRQVPADKDPRGARHSFGFRESLMFVFSTATLQGYRETPRSLPGRILAVFWFIFILIIIISYISQLVVFSLANASHVTNVMPFDSLDDLSRQTKIKVGMVKDGSTYRKMKASKVSAYNKLVSDLNVDVFANNVSDGVEMVLDSDGDYVFLVESSKGSHLTHTNCQLTLVGEGIMASGMGLATPLGSLMKTAITFTILQLVEDGTLMMLQERWWDQRGMCPVSLPSKSSTKSYEFRAHEMSEWDLALPFLCLMTGACLACLSLLGEVVFRKLKKQ